MFEKVFGKKKSIQRSLIIEFMIAIGLVMIFSVIGFYIFVNQEAAKFININIDNYEELKGLLEIIRRGIGIIILNSIIISAAMMKISSSRMLNPLNKIIEATKKVATGNFDVRLETKRDDEIKELVDNFNYMVKELENTENLQREFIDNVSHEIKTPINSIQGFAKLLEDDSLSKEERQEYTKIIIEESDRLLKVSTSMLRLSKLQHQEKITKQDQIDIAEQIRKIIALFEPKWKEKQLEIDVSLPTVYFYGDEELIFQVWTNLIDNAIKFSNIGGKIAIQIETNNGKIIVKIEDNGIGMDKEELDRIYSRFYQVDKSHSGEGSGLGLAIVKRIVELSNGDIKVETEKNVGTTMIVELPLQENEDKILIK